MSISGVRLSANLPANGLAITATAAALRVTGLTLLPLSRWVSSTVTTIFLISLFMFASSHFLQDRPQAVAVRRADRFQRLFRHAANALHRLVQQGVAGGRQRDDARALVQRVRRVEHQAAPLQ